MKLAISSQELVKMLPETQYTPKLKCNNNEILITGAAGFLGIHLLKEIVLSKNYEKVYAIVRNIEKVKKQSTHYDLNTDWLSNIIFIESDLLTLNENNFPEVEYVIHSAAQIHCIKTLKQLWKNNVETTDKISKIYRNNKVFFISTLSVFVSSNKTGNHEPKFLDISQDYHLYGGYAQSKYIGEKIMEKNNHNIIRLGLITGASDKGIFPKDFFSNFIQINHDLGIYPEGYEQAFVDMTPVDYCVKLILKMIKKPIEKIIHIANKNQTSLESFINLLNLVKVSKEKWLEKIQNKSTLDQQLLKFAYFKNESLINNFDYYNLDLFQTTGHTYNIESNFAQGNENLLKLYINQILKDKNAL